MWSTFLSGFGGALLGAAGPFAIAWVNGRKEKERLLIRCAIDAALKDFEVCMQRAEKTGENVFPMSTYVFYHVKFLELAESGLLTEKEIEKLLKERDRILALYEAVPVARYRFMGLDPTSQST